MKRVLSFLLIPILLLTLWGCSGNDIEPAQFYYIRKNFDYNSTDGVFSFSEDIEADKQGLIKAILCFCKQYPKTREKEIERGIYLVTLLAALWAVQWAVFAWARIC